VLTQPTRPDFDAWLPTVAPSFTWDWPHLRYVYARLRRVTRGECKRLMIFMPPRHGKSECVTVRYPVWRLIGRPDLRVIVGAYNHELAIEFSGKARNLADECGLLGPGSKASHDWRTTAGGGVRAVGVGSGVTGRGGNLIIIDDPVKSREEAESEAYRRRVWNWYKDDLYTRLEPNGAMILIQCMTGDTPVRMADGTERPLRDIKVGDRVATYDNGRLSTSTVRNHRSNHLDYIWRIKMISGRIVHANARHPFLVEEHGELKWTRLSDLTTAQRIVTVRGSGESGAARPALPKDATNPPGHAAIVCRTITRRCGQTAIGPHRPMRRPVETRISSIDTASPPPSMMPCLRRRAAGVPSVDALLTKTLPPTGTASSALTTATTPTPFAGFCATPVTLPWGTSGQKPRPALWSNTSDFTTEAIASIEFAGVEEVFDLQIDRTENFIANGLVSHNTRWHDADLAGRLLSEAKNGGEAWDVVSLPALADDNDPLGRAPGAALCPERFDEAALARIRGVMGTYSFEALYQQRPRPAEGALFKRPWFKVVDAAPDGLDWVRYWDLAASTKESADYTASAALAMGEDGTLYIRDMVRGRWEWPDAYAVIVRTMQSEPNTRHGIEKALQGLAAVQELRRDGRVAHVPFEGVDVDRDKFSRALAWAGRAEGGKVALVQGEWINAFLDEVTAFPLGAHDDQVDTISGGVQMVAMGEVGYGPALWN